MRSRNDPCWCGSGQKWKRCHYPQAESPSMTASQIKKDYLKYFNISIKEVEEIEKIREACQLASDILNKLCEKAKAGVTTLELDGYANQLHEERGVIPAPLNYGMPPFPRSICTSLNDVICHGIPDGTVLKEGDIINIDVTCIHKGFFGDCSKMVCIGAIDKEKELVVDVAYESLMRAIAALKPGLPISTIGDVIEPYAESRGCSVVRDFVGHGIGKAFHEGPQVPHFRNSNDIALVPGMTFTIEPMINAGVSGVVIGSDQWTARTKDGRASAQWEHTILVTGSGCEVLTAWKR